MASPIDLLCLQCGLCCNGALFGDVRREHRGDHSPLFKEHGPRVPQPCPAFDPSSCRCAVYAERPLRCRQFECKQLLAVQAGKLTTAAALRKIKAAQALVKRVENLLGTLGFNQTELSFRKRFQRCQRAAERGKMTGDELKRLADLQLAFHRLNALLAENFYA